jgi:multidrug transporter EmrE-like cation transporter
MDIVLVIVGALLNALAQLALKWGVHGSGRLGPSELWTQLPRLMTNPMLIIAVVLYVASLANWMMVLSRLDLSVAYPLMSLAYVFTFVVGVAVFHEPMSASRILGASAIIGGAILLARPQVRS